MVYIILYVIYKGFNMYELLKNIQMNFFLKLFFSFSILFFSLQSFSQLSISKKYTPSGIVNQVLKGRGVEISNISYRGASNAFGYFKVDKGNLGIKEGIILSTGSVFNAIGPNKEADKSTDFRKEGFGLLGKNSFDAAVLEFDFTPQGDTIEFQYVFASDEYPEYVNKEFNDIFGFYISGPGIAGVKNIALLPDGSNVTINNVNQLKNSSYYISNLSGETIEYDGFTKVLTARAIVECGKTYHLILAIADIQDYVYDSAIFLSAKSLSVPTKYDVKQSLSNYYFNDDSTKMLENCTSGKVIINRSPQFSNRNSKLKVLITGSSIVNKDYTNTIPSEIIFAPGELSKEIKFDALFDNENDSIDSLVFNFTGSELCQPIITKFYIKSIDPLNVKLLDDTIHCKGQPIYLKPIIQGGLFPYSYIWSNGSFQDSIQILPTSTSQYTLTVNDQCFKKQMTVTNTVLLPPYLPLSINSISDFTEICPYKPTYVLLTPKNGGGGFKYKWFQNEIFYTDEKIDSIKPSKTSNYRILITDRCGDTISTKFKYTITSPPLISKITGDSVICYLDSTELKVNAVGGYGSYTYRWENLKSTTNIAFSNQMVSNWYYSFTSDECKTFEVKDSFYVRVTRPIVDFEIQGSPIVNSTLNLINKSKNGTKYSWYVNRKYISNQFETTTMVSDSANHAFTLKIIDDYGCESDTTLYKIIYFNPSVYIPNSFTPDNNLFNNLFQPILTSIKEIEFSIYNRWGELIFKTNELKKCFWDGKFNGEICPNDVYIYKLKTISVNNEKKEFIGHVNLIK